MAVAATLGILVFSYIRFSTRDQLKGDSLRRQIEKGEKWIARMGFTPAKVNYRDIGISAYRGRNREHNRALGKFLEDVRSGRVPHGSILLVECLDRLSREGVQPALELFKEILRAGVKIAVLIPYERIYDENTLNDPFALMEPIMAFHLASIESKDKSERVAAWWERKRQELADGKLDKFNSRRPSWIDYDKKTGKFRLNQGAAVIRFIFERTAEGHGQRHVLDLLQKNFKPIGHSKQWNSSFIAKVLMDSATYGVLQPKITGPKGEPIPTGEPVPGYYPAAISESLFMRAAGQRKRKLKMKGPSGDFVNLFTGLLFNAHDRSAMHSQVSRAIRDDGSRYVQRRLVSYNHMRKLPGADRVSVPYYDFEQTVLWFIREIRIEDLESKTSLSAVRQREQELAGYEGRIKTLDGKLADPKNEAITDNLLTAIRSASAKRNELKKELAALRSDLHADVPLTQCKKVMELLANADGEQVSVLRQRLRILIAELVDSIFIKPEKHFGRVAFVAQLNYRNGNFRHVWFGPNFFGGTTRQLEAKEMKAQMNLKIDLRNTKECRKPILREMVKTWLGESEPPEFKMPKSLPDTLGPAANVWLQFARARMSKASYRVVPSKIDRFVEFLGADLPTKAVNSKRWGQWTEWVIEERNIGRLATLTARVTWARAREFVRWLTANDQCGPIPDLARSSHSVFGEKARPPKSVRKGRLEMPPKPKAQTPNGVRK